jgi:toxin ParE1/3/4
VREIRLSPMAEFDLDDIWSYSVAQWDEAQAQHYLMALDTTMKLLAENPHIGRAIDEIRTGYFKFPAASHIPVYRSQPDAIEFIRILHKRMDVDRHI